LFCRQLALQATGFAGNWLCRQLGGTIAMNERQSIWLLGWTVGGVLAMAFVLNAIALAAI
jgi:hypothetical protein